MQISLFSGAKDNQPQSLLTSWAELLGRLSNFETRPTKDGPCWSPVAYKPGSLRGNKGVETFSALVFDLDDVPQISIDILRSTLDVAAVLHSTFSDEDGSRCMRLVLPLNADRPIAEFPAMRDLAISIYSIPTDPATKDPARLFYLPAHTESGPAEFIEVKGPFFGTQPSKPALPADVVVRLSNVSKPESKKLADIILAGEPLATSNRDQAMQRAASLLAFIFPEMSDEQLTEIVKPSIAAMPSDHELSYELAKIDKKLTRARSRKAAEVAEKEQVKSALEGVVPEVVVRYTPDQLDSFAKKEGVAPDKFAKRWIIQVSHSYYVYVNGSYQYPIGPESLALSLPRDLASAPVVLHQLDSKGKMRLLTGDELVKKYGTVARHVEADMALQHSYYDDKTQTFHEAPCPLRPFDAVQHGDVLVWLHALGNGESQKLLDWLSVVTCLDKQAAALLLEGDSGSGKGLLASGIARLWVNGAPTPFDTLVGGWSWAVSQCPFVLADEGLPRNKSFSINDELRRWTGSQERLLTRKYMTDAPLKGSIRLMLASNNNRILNGLEEMSAQDRTAIAQRLVYIKVAGGSARAILEGMTHQERSEWCERKIPETLMWLKQNRAVLPGKRFVVEGTETEMHERLSIDAGLSPEIFEILAGEIASIKTDAVRDSYKRSLLYGGGKLLVTGGFFKDAQKWDKHCAHKMPKSIEIYRAVENVCDGFEEAGSVRYNKVRVDLFRLWCDTYLGSEAEPVLLKVMT